MHVRYIREFLSPFMTCHWVCTLSNTTDTTSGAGNAHPSGVPELTLGFSGIRDSRFLVFYVVFYRSLFVPFFFWPYGLSFDLPLLLIPLVSSSFYSTYNRQ